MSLDRAAILALNDLAVQSIDIPEWKTSVFIRVMTGVERDMMESEFSANKGKGALPNFRARFACMILCDEKGARLFADKDAVELGRKNAAALSRILDAGMKLSGITASEASEIVGESVAAPSVVSGSVSP